MPLSSGHIISKDAAQNYVRDYTPQAFPITVPEPAKVFIKKDFGPPTTFQISDLVSQQTGISKEEKKILEAKVQEMVLAQLKNVEERAYQESYELGWETGRKQAFDKYIEQYNNHFRRFGEVLTVMESLLMNLVAQNEARIVDLVFKIAEKVAVDHIQTDRNIILNVLKEVFSELQKDEKVVVKVSESDFDFIKEVQERLGSSEEVKFLEGHKVEASADISNGGCRVETNYGEVDATVEQRLRQLWTEIRGKIPMVEKTNES